MQNVVTAAQALMGRECFCGLMGSQESYQHTLLQNNSSGFFKGMVTHWSFGV